MTQSGVQGLTICIRDINTNMNIKENKLLGLTYEHYGTEKS